MASQSSGALSRTARQCSMARMAYGAPRTEACAAHSRSFARRAWARTVCPRGFPGARAPFRPSHSHAKRARTPGTSRGRARATRLELRAHRRRQLHERGVARGSVGVAGGGVAVPRLEQSAADGPHDVLRVVAQSVQLHRARLLLDERPAARGRLEQRPQVLRVARLRLGGGFEHGHRLLRPSRVLVEKRQRVQHGIVPRAFQSHGLAQVHSLVVPAHALRGVPFSTRPICIEGTCSATRDRWTSTPLCCFRRRSSRKTAGSSLRWRATRSISLVPPRASTCPQRSRIGGADAGRGNARAQPRRGTVACPVTIRRRRLSGDDAPKREKEENETLFRDEPVVRSDATRGWYQKRFRTRLCSDARAPAGLSHRRFHSRRSRLLPAPNARALPTERPYERRLTCRCSAGSPPSSPRTCCSSRLGCSRRASRRRCTSRLCTRTNRRCPVVRGGSHGRGCSRREVSQVLTSDEAFRLRVAGRFFSMIVPTAKNDVSLFRDDGDENAPSCPRPGGRRTG